MEQGRNDAQHKPVLLDEVLEAFFVGTEEAANGTYIDCTFGRGGHSRAMLAQLGNQGRLIAIDRDPEAMSAGHELERADQRFKIAQGSFSILKQVASDHDVLGKVSGILFDLGVSSPQLDVAERGFSFMREGPLDMRMDPGQSISAASWLAQATKREMVDVFSRYGEERFSKRIAWAIINYREEQPLETTRQLADLIREASPSREKNIHPATRVFQAIRIFINDELGEIEKAMDQVLEVLKPGGRLAVISFHSLEDRIIKRFMKKASQGDNYPAHLPIPVAMLHPEMKIVSKRIRAGAEEIDNNPRSRSAVLRVAERSGSKEK